MQITLIIVTVIVAFVVGGPAYLRLRSRQTWSCAMPAIKRIIPSLLLAAVGMLAPGQVLADRLPSPEERSSIETLLRDAGFQQWGKIELNEDDDFWDVEDAYACDGSKYDLKLNLETLTILSESNDDELTRRP